MSDAFLGDLAQNKLFDIIKPLLIGARTGILSITGRETGEISLDSGSIVHAKTAHSSGEEAFLIIMGWRTGKAAFLPNQPPPKKTITIPTENLLLNWSYRKQDWDKIRQVIPSPNAVFRLALLKNGEDKTITAAQWNILALSNGLRTVSEIGAALGWDEFKVSKVIYQLTLSGLMEKAEGEKPSERKTVRDDFFSKIEMELKKVMGPMAPVMIEDTLIEFGETKDLFPRDQANAFVEALSQEISQEAKRKEFSRVLGQLFSSEK